jgi:cytochrome c biogenesis protein CcmG/thiol:disulfide interchange protein DsbE
VKVGQVAPDFTLDTFDGKQHYRLSDLKSRPVVVLFWTSWCGHCAREATDLETLYKRYKAKDLLVLGVGLDDPTALEEKGKRLGLSYPIGYGSDIGETYDVRAVPDTFVIDRGGRIAASLLGERPIAVVEAAIQKVL